MKTQTTHERYSERVEKARKAGYTKPEILAELMHERKNVQEACAAKVRELAINRNPYPRREAVRLANECLMVIDRIFRELNEEGTR